ncbi:class I SAM-dependent methyltransferase [Novosphingobium sp. ZW T3_23]|uniref:class I SAM-dependent methyltransferase n=1 Tax=Novosphingobium sp. ZW T3_23 TaxID=3378084 RepID=UPI003855133D
MTSNPTHKTRHQLVDGQFGSNASAYVTSKVHAEGTDLDRIAIRANEAQPRHALDLGAGGGHVSYAMARHASQVTACDLAPRMLAVIAAEAERRALANIVTQAAAAEALPFADDTFDFLACRFSTHHWRSAEAGLREARRVLTPGAPALFMDVIAPADPAADTHLQAVELLRDLSHVRDYSTAQWQEMLSSAGFSIVSTTPGRLRMDFADWTARMRTPPERIAAIRALQGAAGSEISSHFAIEADGSFTLDTLLIEAI